MASTLIGEGTWCPPGHDQGPTPVSEEGRPVVTEPPRPTDPGTGSDGSAPWERPRRWGDRGLDATRVDDLLAKLGTNSDEVTGRRSRRRQAQSEQADAAQPDTSTEDAGPIAASDLIAALGGPAPTEPSAETPPEQLEQPEHQHAVDEPTPTGPTDGSIPAAAVTQSPPDVVVPADSTPVEPTPADPTPTAAVPTDPTSAEQLPEKQPVERPPTLAIQPPSRSTPAAAAQASDDPDDLFAAAPFGSSEPAMYRAQDAVDQGVDPAAIVRDVQEHDTSAPRVPDHQQDDTPTVVLPQYSDDVAAIRASLLGVQPGAVGAVAGGPPAPPRGPDRSVRTGGGDGDGDGDRRSNRGFLVAGRSIIAAIAVIVLLYSGYQWGNFQQAEAGLERRRDVDVTLPSNTATNAPTNTKPTRTTDSAGVETVMYPPENILLLGSDSRAGDNGNPSNEDATTEDSANSDTIMIAHISGDRQTVSIISFPRYLDIAAPTCKTWDFKTRRLSDYTQPVTDTSRWRISNAYAVGGPACAVAAVTKASGIHIDRVIDIDFSGFQAMVDALDGVTVNICRPIIDAELNTVAASGGVQVINGGQALNLVRARKVEGDSSGTDGRMRRQQVVLSAMLRQLTSAGTLLNPVELNAFLTAFFNNTHTVNVTLDSLILIAKQLGNLAPGKVNFYSIPHHPSPTKADWDELDPSAEAIFKAIRNDERLPTFTSPDVDTGDTGASSSSPTSSSSKSSSSTTSTAASSRATSSSAAQTSAAPQTLTVDPAQIDLQVVNQTGRAGVAGAAMQALNAGGFQITEDDLLKPDEVVDPITVEYSAANRAAAVMVAASVPNSDLVEVDGLGERVRLVLGSSFDGTITPAAVGDPVPEPFRTTPAAPSTTPTSSAPSTSKSAAAPTSRSTAPSTTPTTAAIDTSGVQAVNAGDATCA